MCDVCYMCGLSLGSRRREEEKQSVKFASAKHQNPSRKTLKAFFFPFFFFLPISGADCREHVVRGSRKYKLANLS